MGRTFEMLKKGDGVRSGPPAPGIVKPPSDDYHMEWTVSEAQVPYIEVGAPGKVVEGSMEVMAVSHPPQVKQPPHPPTEKALSKATVLAQLTEAKPLTVAFEPWSGPTAVSTGIAAGVIAYHQPAHPVSKQYAELWKTLSAGLTGAGPHVLLLSGLRPQVGATTVLLNLAVTGARESAQRVVAVDAQVREPGLASRLGFTAELGLLDVLSGEAALEQTVVKTMAPSLHALPLAPRDDDSALTREALAWLISSLRQRFDVILIDGPDLQNPSRLALLAPACDALFLVAPQGETKSLSRDALQAIARVGGKLRGVLHTHVEI